MVEVDERARDFPDAEARIAKGRLEPGAAAGDYVVSELIAFGGGGSVYEAYHRTSGRIAALKVLHQSLIALPKMVQRFRREVEVLNLLRHPGIVEVWEVGCLLDGRPFFAMERVRGKTVCELLEEEGRLLPEEAVEIFEPVCLALAAAHSAGVIHRDVKTTNIMVLEGHPRRVKLLDFGVAKLCGPAFSSPNLTSEGQTIGTPTSMAPEQILGGAVDVRVDIYALGVLLYRMLAGRPPFLSQTALAQMRQHLEQPAPRPSLRAPAAAPLDAVVLRCMEKDPALRHRSVEELLSAVRAAISGGVTPEGRGANVGELAVAIYVELRVKHGGDEMDLGLADEVGSALDTSEDVLRDAGLIIAFTTGSEVLGVQPLSPERNAAAREIAQVLNLALTLRQRLEQRAPENVRVHANICVHVDEALLRTSAKVEVVGGNLIRASNWAPREDIKPVCVTTAVLLDLEGLTFPPGIQPIPMPTSAPDLPESAEPEASTRMNG